MLRLHAACILGNTRTPRFARWPWRWGGVGGPGCGIAGRIVVYTPEGAQGQWLAGRQGCWYPAVGVTNNTKV